MMGRSRCAGGWTCNVRQSRTWRRTALAQSFQASTEQSKPKLVFLYGAMTGQEENEERAIPAHGERWTMLVCTRRLGLSIIRPSKASQVRTYVTRYPYLYKAQGEPKPKAKAKAKAAEDKDCCIVRQRRGCMGAWGHPGSASQGIWCRSARW